jgi:hypothetical protein
MPPNSLIPVQNNATFWLQKTASLRRRGLNTLNTLRKAEQRPAGPLWEPKEGAPQALSPIHPCMVAVFAHAANWLAHPLNSRSPVIMLILQPPAGDVNTALTSSSRLGSTLDKNVVFCQDKCFGDFCLNF